MRHRFAIRQGIRPSHGVAHQRVRVQAQGPEQSGGQIAGCLRFAARVFADRVIFAMNDSARDARSGEDQAVACGPVVSPTGADVVDGGVRSTDVWFAAKFARPDNQRLGEQAAFVQILDQCGKSDPSASAKGMIPLQPQIPRLFRQSELSQTARLAWQFPHLRVELVT